MLFIHVCTVKYSSVFFSSSLLLFLLFLVVHLLFTIILSTIGQSQFMQQFCIVFCDNYICITTTYLLYEHMKFVYGKPYRSTWESLGMF